MAKPIVHPDLISFIALELDKTPDQLRRLLENEPAKMFTILEQIENSSLAKLDLTLAEAIRNKTDGAPLLAENVALTPRYIKSLLTRQLQDDGQIGPISLAPTGAAIEHYKRKVAERFQSIIDQVKQSGEGHTKILHNLIATSRDLQDIQDVFGEIVDRMLSSPDSMPLFLSALTATGNNAVLANGVNTAFVAMAIMSAYQKYPDTEVRKQALANVGLAALLQDLSVLVEPQADDSRHAERSAAIAGDLGAPAAVAEMVRHHHTITDPEGKPAAASSGFLSVGARILIAANVFLSMSEQEARGKTFETMKSLNYLAESQYVDARAVRILCAMFLPKVKAYVIEKANQIAGHCLEHAGRPILWPVTGDKLPAVFLCQSNECDEKSAQASYIARSIPFTLEGVVITTIQRGEYFTCPLLTRKLKGLYDMIQNHIKKQK